MRERCAVSSSTVPTWPADVVVLSPGSLRRGPPPHAAAASSRAAPSPNLSVMMVSRLERIQRSGGRALELRAGIVGGRQRVGVLALRVEQIAPRVEQLQGRGAPEPVADGCDAIGLLCE